MMSSRTAKAAAFTAEAMCSFGPKPFSPITATGMTGTTGTTGTDGTSCATGTYVCCDVFFIPAELCP